ncbi:MAG: aromatic-amino-acid transaminase [Planctomycetota bacterium]|jgi:aromatic-amino-acid transaminase
MNPATETGQAHHLISSAQGRPAEDPIFAIHNEAVRRAAEGESVIDASLGALLDDQGRVAVLPAVFQALRDVDPSRAAAYAPIAGDTPFREAVIRDVFGTDDAAGRAVCVATAGGTGAIFAAVVNFVEDGHALYTSDLHWGPYRTIADHTRRSVETFPMFADGRFNMAGFEAGLMELGKRQGKVLVLLNFPCHNPTGYSLDDEEWTQVTAALSRAAQCFAVTVLMDVAYARYALADVARWQTHLGAIVEQVPLLVAWSASKSYAQYGARVGALVAVIHDADERARVLNAMTYSCRGTWSNCNHLGILAVASLLEDADRASAADRERDLLIKLMDERVAAFNLAASAAGLSYPRYEAGFFVTIFTPDPARTAAVCGEHGVFIVPVKGAVRVGLCATPKASIQRLVDSLAQGVEAAS